MRDKQVTFGGSFARFAACMLLVVSLLALAPSAHAQAATPSPAKPASSEKSDKEKTDAEKKEEEERKPPLEFGRLVPRFGEETVDPTVDEGPRLMLKPGHWTNTWQRMRANFNDFIGTLVIELLDDNRRQVALEHTRYSFEVARDVPLAKGKQRESEVDILLPQRAPATRLQARINDRDSGTEVFLYQPKLESIPAYQYQLVVLAKEPSRYALLKVTNTVRAPWEEEYDESSQVHYQVSLLKAGLEIPLPENTLAWTSVAFLVWDEVDPTRFSVDQQQALLNWLHWGGRLIVNGPDSLATLQGSFLDAVLPATDAGPRTISTDELTKWSQYWGHRDSGAQVPPLVPARPLSGIKLEPREGAVELPGGENLFLVRAAGRGAVVVSALQLNERDFVNWPGFDGFLNAGLLGRPRRVFSTGPYGAAQVAWADYPTRRLDAHLTTSLRVFARDAQVAANTQRVDLANTNIFATPAVPNSLVVDRPGGVAAWDEFSPAANAARETLLVAAGVQVPGVGFVVSCLAFYLLVLVPVNWLIFHTIERIEWAWIAVPFLALAGTWVVVKQAQLDIGFVRSQTEVAILELQGSHDRGWLARYSAMYSSLATTYEVEFPEHAAAAAMPFPANDTDPTDWQESVVFQQGGSPRLTGLTVSSSATRLIHAEQLVELEGPIRLGKSSQGLDQVENRTQYHLRDVALVRCSFDAQGKARYDGCWLGEIKPKNSAVVGIQRLTWNAKELPFAAERVLTRQSQTKPALEVDPVLRLAFMFADKNDPLATRREETRLVAVIDEALPGMNVIPEASQHAGATVVVAHLNYGKLPTPQPDVNNAADVFHPSEENPEPL
jgi:hypothetical protein